MYVECSRLIFFFFLFLPLALVLGHFFIVSGESEWLVVGLVLWDDYLAVQLEMFRDSCFRSEVILHFILLTVILKGKKKQKPHNLHLQTKMNTSSLNTLFPSASILFLNLSPLCSALAAVLDVVQCPLPCFSAISSLALHDTSWLEGMSHCLKDSCVVRSLFVKLINPIDY